MDENSNNIDQLFKQTARHAAALAEALEPTKAIQRGTRRRVYARRRRLALSGVVVLAAIIIFLVPLPQLHLFGTGTRHTAAATISTTSLQSGSRATANGIPTDFQPRSFTAVSPDEWWLLGTARCSNGSGTCDAIVRTDDGGSKFTGVPSPPVSASEVTQLRFTSALDGYAFDPELWVTTDGGTRWTRIPTRGSVTELAAADGEAYALGCTAANCPGVELLRSPVGSLHWQRATTPVPLSDDPSLAASGRSVYVLGGETNGHHVRVFLVYSGDRGASFSKRVDPCTAVLGGSVTAAVDGSSSIWAACPTGTEAETWQSDVGGRRWAGGQGGFPNSVQLAAASSSVALASSSQERNGVPPNALVRTTNGGQSFSVVLSESGSIVAWVGFSDPVHAYVLLDSGDLATATSRLFASDDAGATWHRVMIKN